MAKFKVLVKRAFCGIEKGEELILADVQNIKDMVEKGYIEVVEEVKSELDSLKEKAIEAKKQALIKDKENKDLLDKAAAKTNVEEAKESESIEDAAANPEKVVEAKEDDLVGDK